MSEWIYFISLTSQLLEYGPGIVLSSMPSTYWYQEILVEISTDTEHAVKIIRMLLGGQRQKWMLVD